MKTHLVMLRKALGAIFLSLIGSALVRRAYVLMIVLPTACTGTMRGGNANPLVADTTSLVQTSSARTELPLLLCDPDKTLGGSERRLKREVLYLLASAGVSVKWHDCRAIGETKGDSDDSTLLRAVLVAREPDRWKLPERVMGATADSTFTRSAIFVFWPAVRRTLRLEEEAPVLQMERGKALIARALARVLVHELIHAVAPQLEHASQGIFAARFTKGTLLAPDVTWNEATITALRAGAQRRLSSLQTEH